MHRFAATGLPRAKSIRDSANAYDDWEELRQERTAFDAVISEWAGGLDADWLKGELSWTSGAVGRNVTRPRWLLVVHLFNHQTHHRGQVHAMLTAAGAKPEDTDIAFMPD